MAHFLKMADYARCVRTLCPRASETSAFTGLLSGNGAVAVLGWPSSISGGGRMKVVAVDDDVVVHMALAMSWDDVELIECTRATGAFMIGVTENADGFVIDRR